MVANQTKANRGRLKIDWGGVGEGGEAVQKEGKAQAIDAIATLTQFISAYHLVK